MPATRKLSFSPDVPMWVVYLVNGKIAIFAKWKANVVWVYSWFEVNKIDFDSGHIS
jgi:hypothetical protein